jgi:hypothetical protein
MPAAEIAKLAALMAMAAVGPNRPETTPASSGPPTPAMAAVA